jgi:hypothetical protein
VSFCLRASRIPLVPRVSDSKPNSSRNCEGWTLVMHRRGRNKCKRMIKPTIIRTLMVKKTIDESMRRKMHRKFISVRDEVFPTKKIKKNPLH